MIRDAQGSMLEMLEFAELVKSGIEGYSLQDKVFNLKSGATADMNGFAYNLLKVTLQNIQLNHQELVLNMAVDALDNLVAEIKTTAGRL
jgi:hypothetical protein